MTISRALEIMDITDIESLTSEKLKKTYKRLAVKYHPDSPNGDEERFKEICKANEVISVALKKIEQVQVINRYHEKKNVLIKLGELISLYNNEIIHINYNGKTEEIKRENMNNYVLIVESTVKIKHKGTTSEYSSLSMFDNYNTKFEVFCDIYVSDLSDTELIELHFMGGVKKLKMKSQSVRFLMKPSNKLNVDIVLNKKIKKINEE